MSVILGVPQMPLLKLKNMNDCRTIKVNNFTTQAISRNISSDFINRFLLFLPNDSFKKI